MKQNGEKTDGELTQICRNHMIYAALYMLGYYALDMHLNFLSVENEEDRMKTKESIGLVGLRSFFRDAIVKTSPS